MLVHAIIVRRIQQSGGYLPVMVSCSNVFAPGTYVRLTLSICRTAAPPQRRFIILYCTRRWVTDDPAFIIVDF